MLCSRHSRISPWAILVHKNCQARITIKKCRMQLHQDYQWPHQECSQPYFSSPTSPSTSSCTSSSNSDSQSCSSSSDSAILCFSRWLAAPLRPIRLSKEPHCKTKIIAEAADVPLSSLARWRQIHFSIAAERHCLKSQMSRCITSYRSRSFSVSRHDTSWTNAPSTSSSNKLRATLQMNA